MVVSLLLSDFVLLVVIANIVENSGQSMQNTIKLSVSGEYTDERGLDSRADNGRDKRS